MAEMELIPKSISSVENILTMFWLSFFFQIILLGTNFIFFGLTQSGGIDPTVSYIDDENANQYTITHCDWRV